MRIDFSSSERSSLGVEWELELVDLATGELSSGSNEILAAMSPGNGSEHPKAKHELMQCCVEVITDVCLTVPQARDDLAATVAEVQEQAARLGLGVMCSGTHPTTDWMTQDISDNPRYHDLVDRNQWLARQLQIFGVHVHVGVRSEEKIMPIVNALLSYVPHFLALSASSPYWVGCDTGLASYRSKVFEALPTAGLPYQLSGWDQFERYMELLISTNAIQSVREVWWDIRPHPNFGTVELRICDGLPTLDEITAVAAMAQCLVEQMDSQIDRGYQLPEHRAWVVRENKWRAARYGLDADIVVDANGRVRPVRVQLRELVEELIPISRRLGCEEELAVVYRILELGASYERQRRVAAEHDGALRPVVDSLLGEMRSGLGR